MTEIHRIFELIFFQVSNLTLVASGIKILFLQTSVFKLAPLLSRSLFLEIAEDDKIVFRAALRPDHKISEYKLWKTHKECDNYEFFGMI